MRSVSLEHEDLVVLDLSRRLRRRSRSDHERLLRFGRKLLALAAMMTSSQVQTLPTKMVRAESAGRSVGN